MRAVALASLCLALTGCALGYRLVAGTFDRALEADSSGPPETSKMV